jgi:hypothetical protein
MKKTTGTILFIVILAIFVSGAFYIIYKDVKRNRCDDVSAVAKILNNNQTIVPEAKTAFFRDENHAIYLEIPEEWNYDETYYFNGERSPMIRFDMGITDEYGMSTGDAMITYYEAGGLTLNEWTQLHLVNDIKMEFGEDFKLGPIGNGKTAGIEIIGTNELHPLWEIDTSSVWSFTYYYYLHDDKIYEFELRVPEMYIDGLQQELNIIKNSVYFGEPFNMDEWKTYTNVDMGFTVQYPAIWEESEQLEQEGRFVGFDEDNLFDGHSVTIITPNEEEYTSLLAGKTMLDNVQLTYTSIDSISAVRIKGSISENYGFHEFTDSVFAMSNGFRVEMVYHEQEFNLQNREYFSQMLKTFKLI